MATLCRASRVGRHHEPGCLRPKRRVCLAALILGCAVALCSGCGIREAYDVDKGEPDAAPTGIPDYRMPPPPIATPPQYTPPSRLASAAASEDEPPRMLRDLEARAENARGYKFVLDERLKRYHRVGCPYAPHNKAGHDFEVQGDQLVARAVLEQTGTHLRKEEIEARGYKPCQHCRPDLGKPPPWFGGQTEGYRERQALPYDPTNPAQRLAPRQ